MMAGVVILLKFAKIRESVSVVASAKERNRDARRARQVRSSRARWSCSGSTRVYASWLTLLKIAIGIVVVAAILAGLYVLLGRNLQRSLGVFFGGFLRADVRPDDRAWALLSFQGTHGLTSFPAVGLFSTYWYDILGQRRDAVGAARLDRRLAQAQRARVRDHGGACR